VPHCRAGSGRLQKWAPYSEAAGTSCRGQVRLGGSGTMVHRFEAHSTVASGPLQLVARGAPLRGNVELLQLGPLIPPTAPSRRFMEDRNGCSRCSLARLCRALDVERVRQQRLMTRLSVSRNERLAAAQSKRRRFAVPLCVIGFGKCTTQAIGLVFADLFDDCLTELTHCA